MTHELPAWLTEEDFPEDTNPRDFSGYVKEIKGRDLEPVEYLPIYDESHRAIQDDTSESDKPAYLPLTRLPVNKDGIQEIILKASKQIESYRRYQILNTQIIDGQSVYIVKFLGLCIVPPKQNDVRLAGNIRNIYPRKTP